MSHRRNAPVRVALTAVLAGALCGCPSTHLDPTTGEVTVQHQEDAGSTHVAVLSSAPFEDYRDALQPTFKMGADDALSQAIPSTLLVEERILDALRAAVKVALPSTSVTQTDTTTATAGSAPTTKTERAEKLEPGDASKLTFGDSPAKDQDVTKLAPKDSIVTGSPGLDPMLRHLVATALYQEVQMLNRYVRDAAGANDSRYAAHVVRLQVSVLPQMRNLPYDVYTTISFFNGDFECGDHAIVLPKVLDRAEVESAVSRALEHTLGPAAAAELLGAPSTAAQTTLHSTAPSSLPAVAQTLNALMPLRVHGDDDVEGVVTAVANAIKTAPTDKVEDFKQTLKVELACRLHSGTESAPQVVPLLVTDSIEAATHSRSVEQVRQFLLALSATLNGVGLGGDFQHVEQQVRNALGRDLNSTFTVGRISDNTIRLRFGAVQNPQLGYAMVPQTHNVTLLVLVDKRAITGNAVRFVSSTEFAHARTGQRPGLRTNWQVRRMASHLLDEYEIDPTFIKDKVECDKLVQQVLGCVDRNDYAGFERIVAKHPPKVASKESLWLDVVKLKTGGRYTSGRVLFREERTPTIYAAQKPVLLDDGEKSSTLSLVGVANLRSTTGLVPLLTVGGDDVPATAVTLVENTGRLGLSFPSLKVLGFKYDKTKPPMFRLVRDGTELFQLQRVGYRISKAEAPKSVATVSTGAKVIRSAADGTGQVSISLSSEPIGPIKFKIEGAEIRPWPSTEKPPPIQPQLQPKDGRWLIAGPANLDLRVGNLDPTTPVVITANGAAEADGVPPAKVTFTVQPLTPPEKKP